jgi:hypothetical protein
VPGSFICGCNEGYILVDGMHCEVAPTLPIPIP